VSITAARVGPAPAAHDAVVHPMAFVPFTYTLAARSPDSHASTYSSLGRRGPAVGTISMSTGFTVSRILR
jgi:hypothetical protein